MSSDVAIRALGISKRYMMFERPDDRLKQMIVPRMQRLLRREQKRYFREFTALDGISFEVKRGETVGIIGRNGCGKSTLLQVVCGTLQPTSGSLEVNGRIAALLELGAGFNPEFTGRENVFMNSAILGLSHADTEARFDDIARFADIGQFIDQPVKSYSSGMYVRLAFAIAINVAPDILVIDEALAVGDEAFQRKCFARIEDIKDQGGTILFVSHGAQTIIQLCDRAMLIDRGEILLEGRPKTVVSQYQRLINLTGAEAESVRVKIKSMECLAPGIAVPEIKETDVTDTSNESLISVETPNGPAEEEMEDKSWFDPSLVSNSRVDYESGGARIRDVQVTTRNGRQVNVLQSGRRYIYKYMVDFETAVNSVGFGMFIKTVDGIGLGGGATDFVKRYKVDRVEAGSTYEVSFDVCWSLNPGTYFLNAGVTGLGNQNYNYKHRLLDVIAVRILPSVEQIGTGSVNFDPRPHLQLVTGTKAVQGTIKKTFHQI